MSDELKIVISLKGTEGMVGLKAPDCDPIFLAASGDLPAVLGQIPAFVEKARLAWTVTKTYPKTTAPLPSATPAPVTTAISRPAAPPKPPAPKLQPSFDL
jgi:hypothetical protein